MASGSQDLFANAVTVVATPEVPAVAAVVGEDGRRLSFSSGETTLFVMDDLDGETI